MRVIGFGFVAGIIGIAGIAAASSILDGKPPGVTETSSGNVALSQEPKANTSRQVVAPTADSITVQQAAVPAPIAPPVATAAPSGFVLVEGRTALADSIYATRTGDSVIVNFDAQGFRTRRYDKFENTVRTTLPLVVGKLATTSVDSIPQGSLLPSRDVIGALTTQGMLLTLSNGVKVRIRALTRVGRDGPLAVGYLVAIDR
jgi:hypothetical protein